jgi:hypothetical protein
MHYLAEFYLPGTVDLAGLASRARRAAEQVSGLGSAVRFRCAIHVGQDESCFAVFEADSPDTVAAAGALAGLVFDRIVEASISDPRPLSP